MENATSLLMNLPLGTKPSENVNPLKEHWHPYQTTPQMNFFCQLPQRIVWLVDSSPLMVHGPGLMDLLGASPTGRQESQVMFQIRDGSGCLVPIMKNGKQENGMMAVNPGLLELMATSVKSHQKVHT